MYTYTHVCTCTFVYMRTHAHTLYIIYDSLFRVLYVWPLLTKTKTKNNKKIPNVWSAQLKVHRSVGVKLSNSPKTIGFYLVRTVYTHLTRWAKANCSFGI